MSKSAEASSELLAQALASQSAGDQRSYRAACLTCLKETHGVDISDRVTLTGGVRPRDVLITDFSISLHHDNLLQNRFAWFAGHLVSPTGRLSELEKHGQLVTCAVRKLY